MDKGYNRTQVYGFLFLFCFFGVLAGVIFFPFFKILAIAAIFAVLVYPVHLEVKKKIQNESLASLASTLLFLVAILLPLWLVGQQVFNELVDVYQRFKPGSLVFNSHTIAQKFPPYLQNLVRVFENDLAAIFAKLTNDAFSLISQLLSNLAGFFLSLFLFIFIIFFFFRDNAKIRQIFTKISPLSLEYESLLFVKLENAIVGVVKGSFLIAVIQGSLASIGYLVFSLPQPFLWGAVTALCALVPAIGTSIALIPAVLYLWLTGHAGHAIGLAVWGGLLVGTIDNIVGPKLIGSQTKLHPLLVLLSILGGIQLFGFLGFLFGPIIMAVFMALLEIYLNDLNDIWK
jgi:predicted PurR-regulated permease PerM